MIRSLEKDKKGNIMALVFLIGILFLILFGGFILVVGSSVLNWVFDETVPIFTSIGVQGDVNFTEISDVTIVPLNNLVQNFTWMVGVLYFLALMASVGVTFALKAYPERWLMGLYFVLMISLVMGGILISNIYEDFHDDAGDLGDRLREHTMLSFMIIYSPAIFTIIGFLTGMILFSIRDDGGGIG